MLCQYGGGCVPLSSRCDGVSDCPDLSDEADCLALDNTTLTLSILSANRRQEVCGDGWTEDWSRLVCTSLGFSYEAVETVITTVSQPSEISWWTLNQTASVSPQPLQIFQDPETDTCQSQSTVSVKCQSFGE